MTFVISCTQQQNRLASDFSFEIRLTKKEQLSWIRNYRKECFLSTLPSPFRKKLTRYTAHHNAIFRLEISSYCHFWKATQMLQTRSCLLNIFKLSNSSHILILICWLHDNSIKSFFKRFQKFLCQWQQRNWLGSSKRWKLKNASHALTTTTNKK